MMHIMTTIGNNTCTMTSGLIDIDDIILSNKNKQLETISSNMRSLGNTLLTNNVIQNKTYVPMVIYFGIKQYDH